MQQEVNSNSQQGINFSLHLSCMIVSVYHSDPERPAGHT